MADISNVDATTIKDLYERLEGLSCTGVPVVVFVQIHANI